MHPNQPRQPIRRDQIILAIGAVQEATRPNWPKRGEIVITDKNTGLKLVSDLLDAGWKLIAPKQFNNFHDAFMSLSKGE